MLQVIEWAMNSTYTYVKTVYTLLLFFNLMHADFSDRMSIIDKETFLVYRRYYFIARLDNTIELLKKLYLKSDQRKIMLLGHQVDSEEILPRYECEKFKHKTIRYSIACIHETDCIKPLFNVWDSFKGYKLLKDDLFIEDFSKEIFLIMRNTINYLQRCQLVEGFKHSCMYSPINAYSLDVLLQDIDCMVGYLHNCSNSSQEVIERFNNLADLKDLRFLVNTDDVAFRFYCLKRIRRVMDFLGMLSPEELSVSHKEDGEIQFKPYKNKSVVQLWDDLVQYKYIDDEQSMRYFLCSLYIILYQQTKKHNLLDDEALEVEEGYMMIENHMDDMPIEELLDAIDGIMNNIVHIHQHYQHSGLSLMQWVKVYWWIPAALFSSVCFKLIKYYYFHTSNLFRDSFKI